MSSSQSLVIRSAANPTIRRLVKLRDHRRRRKAGAVLVDGWREVLRAVESGLTPSHLYLSEQHSYLWGEYRVTDSDSHQPTAAAPEPAHDDPRRLTTTAELPHGARELIEQTAGERRQTVLAAPLFEKISYGQSARAVVAEFAQPDRSLTRLSLPENPFILVLDEAEKPGNVGAVFRCADAAGVDAVLLSDGTGDLFNPNAIRSSLGTVFSVPAAVAGYAEVVSFLATRQIRVLAARVEASSLLWSTDFSGPLAVVLGSESRGLGRRWCALGETPISGVRIPMQGQADSLNLSVSAAVIAFEAKRSRSNSGV